MADLFSQCLALRKEKERCREERRERSHAQSRLTWVMSQETDSQQEVQQPPALFGQTDGAEEEEDEDVKRISNQLTMLVSSWSLEQLRNLLIANACHADFILFVKSVFECSKPKTKQGLDRLLFCFEITVRALAERAVERRSDLVAELLQQTKSIPDTSLAFMIERTLDIALSTGDTLYENGNDLQEVLEILCKLVNCIAALPAGSLDPENRCSTNLALADMDGKEFKLFIIRQLCDSKHITERTVIPLLIALKDLCYNVDVSKTSGVLFDRMERRTCDWLKQTRCSAKLGKIFFHFFTLSRFFASKDRACKFVVEVFFKEQQAGEEGRIPLATFGQVLSNFSLVCSQDADLGKAFLKVFDAVELSKTGLAFLLSLSRIKRFEEACFDSFLRRVKTAKPPTAAIAVPPPYETHLLQLCDDIAACKRGAWELVLPSLVRAATKLADAETMVLPHPSLDLDGDVALHGVGVSVLVHCFKVHPLCRIDLLNEVFKRSLCSPLQQVLPFIRMLYALMRDEGMRRVVIGDFAQLVKEVISMLPNCQPRVAHGLVRTIFYGDNAGYTGSKRELQEIRDHAMVVFRKTLFLREVRPRFVALFGILALFKQEQDEDALNCLKRCLSQQCEIRAALYSGLLALPKVCSQLVVLTSHFQQLLDEANDVDVPPINFQLCIDAFAAGGGGKIIEPVAGLLQCAIHGGFDPSTVIARIANAQVALFSLDKTSTFDSCITGGSANRSMAILVIESCEVLINYLVERRVRGTDDIARLFRLQRAVRRLVEKNMSDTSKPLATKTKRRKKAVEGEEEENRDDGDMEEEEEEKPNKRKSKADIVVEEAEEEEEEEGGGGKRQRGAITAPPLDAPLPEEGAWLSESTLLALFTQAQTVPLPSMLELSTANSNSLESLQTRTGFHNFLLQCIKHRLKLVKRLCQRKPTPMMPFASKHSVTANGNTTGMDAHDDALQYSKDMARTCAGGGVMDVEALCIRLGPLLRKAVHRYDQLEDLAPADAGAAAAEETAASSSKRGKRKPANAAASTTTTTLLGDARALRELAIDCLKNLLLCVSASSTQVFEQVVASTYSLERNGNVFHLAAVQIFNLVTKNLSRNRLSAAFAAFDLYCVVVNAATTQPPNSSNAEEEEEIVAHHVSLCKQLLSTYELKSSAHVKQIVKFYLDLNTKHFKGDLSLVCSELASHVMAGNAAAGDEDNENELRMVHHSRLPTLQVLVAYIVHAMEEIEMSMSGGGGPATALQQASLDLEQVSHLLVVFLAKTEEGEARDGFKVDIELLLKSTVKFYKVTTKLFKALIAGKQQVAACSGDVGRLVQQVAKHLSPLVDEHLKELHTGSSIDTATASTAAASKRGKKPAAKKRARPGNKLVPEVVFYIEQYEVTLLKASKACEAFNFLAKFGRRTMARDFKVNLEQLKSAMEMDEEEHGNSDGGGEEEEEEEEE